VSKLFGYQFTVEFKPGKQNAVADALSHRDEEPLAVFALSLPGFELYDKRTKIVVGIARPNCSIIDDVILYKGCIFLSSSSGS
jgi:hypothetical protein